MGTLIHNALIINEGKSFVGSVLIEGETIEKIYRDEPPVKVLNCSEIVSGNGLWLLPGLIDDHVHFREPGLTHKGGIASESRAAIAGGITSFMDMPNTKPQTTTVAALNEKLELAAGKSYANYAFYIGSTNDNLSELKNANPDHVCGIKVFMGSSTGNMLVDSKKSLERIFAEIDLPIAVHCEKEEIIRRNIDRYRSQLGDNIPLKYHPLLRSEEACYRSAAEAAELADKYGSRLHILHLSTARELGLLTAQPLSEKKITGEVCVHHLWFSDEDYGKYGALIKWNPAIKTKADRDGLLQGVLRNKIDIIATDHAPHLPEEKQGGCLQAASGGPLIQHSLQVMLELSKQGKINKETVVEKMCHAPAELFRIAKRGYIREGYCADLVLVNPNAACTVTKDNILYKCGWSPFEGCTFSTVVEKTFLNGKLAFDRGVVYEIRGQSLRFER
jgi:dihydroorotase